MYTRSGELVVSTAQEGLIRLDPSVRVKGAVSSDVEKDPALFPSKVKSGKDDGAVVDKPMRSRL